MFFQAFTPNSKVPARNRDRTRFTGWGIEKGLAGGASKFLLNPGSSREVNLRNTDILTMGPGDILHVSCGGAGGWGDPYDRDPAMVLLAWRRGWVTLDHARTAYGVVIEYGAVDVAATAALRRNERPAPPLGVYDLGPERTAFERVWTDTNYAMLTDCLATLPVYWRFYAQHRTFAAIEAKAANPRSGDGTAVQAAGQQIVAELPQLAVAPE